MFVRSTTYLVTLAAFLVHAVWGCCAHHAHASEVVLTNGADHSHTAASVNHADGHSHCSHETTHDEHQNLADKEPCENHDHPYQDCDEGSCSFANSSKVHLSVPSVTAMVEAVPPVNTSLSFLQSATQTAPGYPRGARSTDRARQLLQTWLL
jgi:hypothetical protein